MSSVLIICVSLVTIVLLINRKVHLGLAMLAGSGIIFFATGPTLAKLTAAVWRTATGWATWEIMLALYFVMCLEFQLRTSGIIDGLLAASRKIFRSDRFLLALMPAFLGFLPSLGGAIFSAPLVENAARPFAITPERKTAINFWFRHVWEFTNPIMTGMLLASQLSGIALGDLAYHMLWVTGLTIVIGWILLIAPLRPAEPDTRPAATEADRSNKRYLVLAAGPILANFMLVVLFRLSAALSMAVVVTAMTFILRRKVADVRAMLAHALDGRLLWGIASIMLFQQVLSGAGIMGDIATLLGAMAVPATVVIGIVSFLGGLLTGTSQGFVAIAFPFIALLAPGDMNLVLVCFVLGMAGEMLSPVHLCLLVTLDYFKADFLRSLRPIAALEVVVVAATCAVVVLWG